MMYKYKHIHILFLMCLFFVPFSVFAQNVNDVVEEVMPEDATILANVNVVDSYIESQDGRDVEIVFTVQNDHDKVQSDIRYAVNLLVSEVDPTDETVSVLSVVDERVYGESFGLMSGESATKKITYHIPEIFTGDFNIGISLSTTNGLSLALIDVGEVNVSDIHDGVEIVGCHLSLEDGTKYTLDQGVDVADDEKLFFTCGYSNRGDQSVTVTPEFSTYQKSSLFGESVEMQTADNITIGPKGYEKYAIEIPKAEAPQSYEVTLVLKNGDEVVSNKMNGRYILQGESATIRDIQFDKISYSEGETARITAFSTARADLFPDSRISEEGGLGEKQINYIDIEMHDKDGSLCGMIKDQEAKIAYEEMVFDMTMQKDCKEPRVFATIKNADGAILDNVKIIAYEKPEASQTFGVDSSMSVPKVLIVVLVLTSILIACILLFGRKKSGGVGIFIFIFFGAAFFIVHISSVDALTLNVPAPSGWGSDTVSMVVTANFTNSNCNYITGRAVMDVCGNNSARGIVYIQGSKVGEYFYKRLTNPSSWHGTKTFGFSKRVSPPRECSTIRVPVRGDYLWHDLYRYSRSGTLSCTRACTSPICGKRHAQTYAADVFAYPSSQSGTDKWCSRGSERNFSPSAKFPDYGETVRWNCVLNGRTTSCWSRKVDPQCGTAHETTRETAPTTGLCTTGSAVWTDAIAADGQWNWRCGNNDCWANMLVRDGQCNGTSARNDYSHKAISPDTPLCMDDPQPISVPEFSGYGAISEVSWVCDGINGGDSPTCTAQRLAPPPCSCEPISGGVSANTPSGTLCNPSAVTAVVSDDGGMWSWVCQNASECTGSATCTAECVEVSLKAPGSVYVAEDESKDIEVHVKIEGYDHVRDPNCTISGAGADIDVTNFDSSGLSDAISVTVTGTTDLHATCNFEIDCDDNGTFAPRTLDDSAHISAVCAERTCNAQGMCQMTPKDSSVGCSSTCNSDADCTTGRMIETRP